MKKALRLAASMGGRISPLLKPGLVCALFLCPLPGWCQAYSITQLPVPAGMVSPTVTGMNDNGQVVGYAYSSNFSTGHGLLWNNGQVTVLPALGGVGGGFPTAINNLGVVTGYSFVPKASGSLFETYHGFVWSSQTGIRDLALPFKWTNGAGINDAGAVIGSASNDQINFNAFVWTAPGAYFYLPPPPGATGANGFSINSAGAFTVAGNNGLGAVIFNGTTTVLAAGGTNLQYPFSLNNFNQTVGAGYVFSGVPYPNLPAFWDNTGALTFLPLPNDAYGYGGVAAKINDSAEAVGYYQSLSWGQLALYWRKGQLVDLHNYFADPSLKWILQSADTINNRGQIAGSGLLNFQPASYLLTPPLLIRADADRNGTIKFDDASDATSGDQPFRFWINNDEDRIVSSSTIVYHEIEQDDVDNWTKAGPKDSDFDTIPCERDLEDFARLGVYTKGLCGQLQQGKLFLALKWADTGATSPSIKVFRATDGGTTAYLTDVAAAQVQLKATALSDARYPGSSRTTVGTTDLFVLPQTAFAQATEDNPVTYFIFEGCTAGKGRLQVLLLKLNADNSYQILEQGDSLWLELKDPRDLVERWSCENAQLTPLAPVSPLHQYPGSPTFARPTNADEQDYVLYVHGWNMKEFEKQRWLETTYKRLWHLGYKGRVGGFSWPCGTSVFSYDPSEERAWQSADELVQHMLNLVTAGYRVHVLAHSMGNVVASEALRLAGGAPLVATYVASQAALPAHTYDPTVPSRTDFTFKTPNVYGTYWLPSQSATFPATWQGTNPAYMDGTYMGGALRYVNFYNSNDYALTGNSLLSHPGWMLDQRLKPDSFFRGYSYSSGAGFTYLSLPLSFPNDRYSIFSYGAQARSNALGATPVSGAFRFSIDLGSAPIGFGKPHLYHSAQFRSFAANRNNYWRAFLDACGFPNEN